ncbi:MAG: CYTH domain-containing protein [Oscillospiraceae bacterium]|nr:CYTH domain-containing protein [Oscillospiraceae bacterium]
MGQELEFKLHLDGPAELERVLADPELNALRQTDWRVRPMRATYYDTPDRRLGVRRWTLRFRQEGAQPVVCLKTPADDPRVRCELEVTAPAMGRAALEALVQAGAPAVLLELSTTLIPVCGAEFTRRSAMLTLPDGSTAELAGDHGILRGPTEQVDFTELELELYSGAATETEALARRLCQRYGLHEEPKSKFARARDLK